MNQQNVFKHLSDYPVGQWMEAASGCSICDGAAQVRITHIDETDKNFGDVNYKNTHKDRCPYREEDEGEGVIHAFAGWEFVTDEEDQPRRFSFMGQNVPSFSTSADVRPCLHCWRLIVAHPLTLFTDQETPGAVKQFDFCYYCAQQLGVIRELYAGVAQ